MTYNIHLYPSDFNYEIRIEKEAKAINKLNYFKKIFLLGAGKGNFKIDKNIYVKLFGFENNNKIIGQKIISFIIFYLSVLFFLSNKKVKLINAHSLSVLPLAFLLKIIKGSKLVYDTHELETETDQTNFFRRIIFKYIEKKIKYIPILNYFNYNKKNAIELLEKKYDWKRYGGKNYESIFTRFFQGYILPNKYNYDKRKDHLSNLIMSGQISRSEALNELSKHPYPNQDLLKADFQFFLKKFNFTQLEFDTIMKEKTKVPADFKSYEGIFKKLKPLVLKIKEFSKKY